MHDYQKHRICTLLDPTSDPLGKGFHTIQAVIAIGSGGPLGKGWLKGTQAHLEFIPEKHTDFIFAVFSEEFGLAGGLVLLFALHGADRARAIYRGERRDDVRATAGRIADAWRSSPTRSSISAW